MGVGRFANKQMTISAGIQRDPTEDAAAYFDGDTYKVTRPTTVEGAFNAQGDVTATGAVLNSVKIKGGHSVTAWWSVIATWDMGAVPGIVGSTNAVITTNVAMSGAAVGDFVHAQPIGSMALDLHWASACYTAGAVNVRAWYTGSVGAYTPGNVPFKITALKLA